MKIQALNLLKNAAGKPILKGITADFTSGLTNVIIGPNGAGKTTLLKILGALAPPTDGEVFYDGKPLSRMNSRQKTNLRRRIGFSFQEELFFDRTVMENLAYPLQIRGAACDTQLLSGILKKFGLDGTENQKALSLSGGQKKRLQIARSIITKPDCILADEPSAALDPVSVAIIEEVLSEQASRGALVIITTHNIAQARNLGGKIFIMDGGKFIQEGSPDEIFSQLPPASLRAADYSFADNVFEGALHKSPNGKIIFKTAKGGLAIETAAPYLVNPSENKSGDGKVYAVIRSEDIFVSVAPISSSARNSIKVTITELNPMGNVYQIKAAANGVIFETVITKQSIETFGLKKGSEAYFTFKATAVHIIDERAR